MWWILGIVVGVLLLILIITFLVYRSIDRGDYKDGGGTQVGGDERIPFFTSANDRAGMWGEKVVNYHLLPLLREDEYLLANVLLPLRNGYKTEIDCILISRKGVFCIETKNWVGHISGSDDDEYWYQEYDDPYMSNRQHKNPVKQNEWHCSVLKRILHNRYRVMNAVIFADLEDGWGIHSDYAYTISEFKYSYRKLGDVELNISQVNAIYQTLLPFVASPKELEIHREETHKRFN